MKVVAVFLSVFALTFFAFGQRIEKNKRVVEYPNELEGFKLMKDSKIKDFITTVRTSRDWNEVKKILPENCGRVCIYNEDWELSILQYLPIRNNDFIVRFSPRKSISFSKIKFPKYFKIDMFRTTYQKEVIDCWSFEDKYGLKYTIAMFDSDTKYKKYDLVHIEYGSSIKQQKSLGKMILK